MDSLPAGTVTFLFTDIEGSTALAQQHPAELSGLLARHHTIVHEAVAHHQGHVFRTTGDGFCAAFSTAGDALAAALDAQRALQQGEWVVPLSVRMGLHTGAALTPAANVGDDVGYLTLTRAQRVMAIASGGQVLLSGATAELVRSELPADVALRDLGEHRLKGLQNSEHLWQVVAPDLRNEFPVLKTGSGQPNNLPERRSRFIGREAQLAQVQRSLQEGRLATLSGSGGIGKTRLALEAARHMLPDYVDGAWLVELAPLADPELVVQETAAVLGVHSSQAKAGVPLLTPLTDFLAPKKLLLILDNCEHVIEACARLVEHLLDHCDGLRILATSREALGIEGETILHVPSLSLPAGSDNTLEGTANSEAVQLFVDRAGHVKPGYSLNQRNAAAIHQICRRLDGIALAIELAASRVNLLQAEQIAARLDNGFRLLTGGSRTALPRQQTLWATIDWSYNLLSREERLLLQRLAVFAGGWSLEAAERVCAGDGFADSAVFDLLAQLENKSLVICDRPVGETPRFRMLEATRLYTAEKLAEQGDVDRLRERHLKWCAGFAEAFGRRIETDARVWMKLAEVEIDNLRAAFEWAFSGGDQANCRLGVRIVLAAWRYWSLRDDYREQLGWLERGLARLSGESDEANYLRGRLLLDLGFVLLWWSQDYARGRVVMAEGISTLRRFMPEASAVLPHKMAMLAYWEDDPVVALSLIEESIAIGRSSESSDKASLARDLYWRAYFYKSRKDYSAAYASADESLRLSRQHGYTGAAGIALKVKGDVAMEQGDLVFAKACYEASLPLVVAGEDRQAEAGIMGHLGGIDLANGDFAAARVRFADGAQLNRNLRGEESYYSSRTYEGIASLFQGDLEFARSLLLDSLPHFHIYLDDVAVGLAGLAYLAKEQGDTLRAGQLLGAAAAIVASMGKEWDRRNDYTRASYYRLVEMSSRALDQAAWERGYQMMIDQAIEYAVS